MESSNLLDWFPVEGEFLGLRRCFFTRSSFWLTRRYCIRNRCKIFSLVRFGVRGLPYPRSRCRFHSKDRWLLTSHQSRLFLVKFHSSFLTSFLVHSPLKGENVQIEAFHCPLALGVSSDYSLFLCIVFFHSFLSPSLFLHFGKLLYLNS